MRHQVDDVGMRHRVIHQAAGNQLPSFTVILQVFAQRLPQALHHTTVKLTEHNHRVDHAAHVVDRRVSNRLNVARVGVNFNFANMAAIGPRRACDRAR